ncbi:Gfo/Idh/MocA family protein [Frigidibacter sp. ROC022]|uniref:Gfo/Idh/MocA family protein n=1 Tax=Frigidibacter sp. ROC022 TaxID=2971796 RepID=UPI00215A3248|nr:Gfo/Idh/MocA family oxidoreductase [Frigidibacter sp. ROC022]MCR8723972.1 Gfo/Idh/MocA family oxidoreductase [Frigidibacter sp. ROC022]
MSSTQGVALIGAGMVAGTYADALSNLPELRVTGVLANRAGSAEAFLQKHGLPGRAYADQEEVTADPEVDFAILLTPPDARVEIVRTLAAAGKPILMEKPVERSLKAATEIVEICESAGVPLGIALQHRARPTTKTMHDLIDGGDFGALRLAEINVPWWRPQSYYDAPGRGTYARDGGGVMITQAIHAIDLALQFTGPVSAVTALCTTTGLHRMEAEDTVVAGLELANGATASLFATTAAYPGREDEIILHFDHATMRLAQAQLSVAHHDGRSETIGSAGGSGSGADPMAFTSDWHRSVIADFAEALRDGRPPMITGRSALPVHALIEAIEQAGRSGRRQSLQT